MTTLWLAPLTTTTAAAAAAAFPIEPAYPRAPAFVPAGNLRLYDSRPEGPRVAADSVTEVRLPAPTRSVPVLNLTVDGAETDGFLTAFQCDRPRPGTSNLNYSAGSHAIANAALPMAETRTLGGDSAIDKVCVYSSAAASLIVDLLGYVPVDTMYTHGGQTLPGYRPVGPTRVIDTRQPASAIGRLAPGSVVPLTMLQPMQWREPDAVAVNLTAVDAAAPGYLSIIDCSTGAPVTSALNFGVETVASFTMVETQTPQCLYSSAEVDVVVDVFGYLLRGGPHLGEQLDPVAEATPWEHGNPRLLDTRSGLRPMPGQIVRAAWRPAAADAGAVATTITIVNADAAGYATAFPCGEPVPPTSTVNFEPGQARAGFTIVLRGDDAEVCVYTSAAADVIVDEVTQFSASPVSLAAIVLSCAGHFGGQPAPIAVDATRLRVYPQGGLAPYQLTLTGVDGWTPSVTGNQVVLTPADPSTTPPPPLAARLRVVDATGSAVDQDLLIDTSGSPTC